MRADTAVDVQGHSAAMPRWGWSGAAQILAPTVDDQRLSAIIALLPTQKSSTESIKALLHELGARYLRYLHQDEFGPTRAEQIEALRELLKSLGLLRRDLEHLPDGVHLALEWRLAANEQWRHAEVDRSGVLALEALYEAAADVARSAFSMGETGDAVLLTSIGQAAEHTWVLIEHLDTTTDNAVVVDSDMLTVTPAPVPHAELMAGVVGRIDQLRARFALTLTRLQRMRGPEPGISVRWLVWNLCRLWAYETNELVTSSAVRGGKYTSEPQSMAGKFVREAVQALQPSEAWLCEHELRAVPVRAQIVSRQDLHRAVHLAMREYVGRDRPRHRRGRPKFRRATP